jgi:hypothetical protein
MDQALKAFIECANIARYIEQIKTETDPFKRALLATLLEEEKTKQDGSVQLGAGRTERLRGVAPLDRQSATLPLARMSFGQGVPAPSERRFRPSGDHAIGGKPTGARS